MILKFLLLVSFTLLQDQVLSHVSLKYPPARNIDLDFLDSFRTIGGCGMEAGDERTLLASGSILNFTWHLGYPHKGGYRLELIDRSQQLSKLLVPEGGDEDSWEVTDKTAQYHSVQLPNVQCEKCYLKFQRQATEWGKKYKFRSCADVALVTDVPDSEKCSGHGTWTNGQCRCDRLREGDKCQYQTLCQTDSDCNGPKGQGRCISVDSVIFPYKECYCADGWFGQQCQHSSRWGPGQANTVDKSRYQLVPLGNGAELLWRITDSGDEIEMVMSAPTTTWIGLGWRPSDTDKSCYNFPETVAKYRASDFHAMDCMDMVIGMAREGVGRVADYYTRDRSTPRLDSVWGGEDNLLSSHAWEEDGSTTMRFIRKLSGGVADHDILGSMTLIWAHGQIDNFYLPDQLKFHSRKNRGITSLELPSYLSLSSLSSLSDWSPVNIGILVSCVLIAVILFIQICQNFDKKLSFLTPFSKKSFTPDR